MKKNIFNGIGIFLAVFMLLISCKKDETTVLPALKTLKVTDVTDYTAVGYGYVISEGNPVITERGICWSTAATPTITDNKVIGKILWIKKKLKKELRNLKKR